jgi:hypothetical protein
VEERRELRLRLAELGLVRPRARGVEELGGHAGARDGEGQAEDRVGPRVDARDPSKPQWTSKPQSTVDRAHLGWIYRRNGSVRFAQSYSESPD